MNYLLGQDRAIVTDIPGTTRDIIEESLTINGIVIRLFDTAGIRHTGDKVETIGIEKTKKLIEDSDIALVIMDGTLKTLTKENIELLNITKNKKRIIAVNKSDIDVNNDFIGYGLKHMKAI